MGPAPDLLGQPASIPPPYREYFVHYADRRSLSERVLNSIGLTSSVVGRSFALVAGVDSYPNLPSKDRFLKPARVDVEALVGYLRDFEFFDEIVVLRNEAVTDDNFKFFLQAYFPDRLRAFPKSRFLFAYSGHGIQDGSRGYLLQARASSFYDKANSINLAALSTIYRETSEAAYHSLALINSCHSGAFIRRPFGDRRLLPRDPGAHVITAGAGSELTWSMEDVGPGSVFFEKLFAGLDGRADSQPQQASGTRGDGLITAPEIYDYLNQEVQLETNQEQHPQMGDFSPDQSLGSFFFLNRRRQVAAGTVSDWSQKRQSYGTSVREAKAEPPPAREAPRPAFPTEPKDSRETWKPIDSSLRSGAPRVSQPVAPESSAPKTSPPASAPLYDPILGLKGVSNRPQVVLHTSKGDITLELDRARVPKTVENFLAYILAGHYDGTVFHRVIPGFMIQGGGYTAELQQKATRPPIENEAKKGLQNARGTLSMARTADPHSATSQFFINVVDNKGLDPSAHDPWGYAVFGRVVQGMDVVDAIAKVPTGTRGLFQNVPNEPIVVTKAEVKP